MMKEDKIKSLLLYRNNIKPDSIASQILETSYGVSEFSLFQISQKIKKPYPYTKKIMFELKKLGYLKSESRGRYSITQKGRWFVICQRFDGISFLSLCLLAEVYHRVKSDPAFFYQFSTFRQCYEIGYKSSNSLSTTAIYLRTNILKSLQSLKQRNLVYAVHGDFIKISKPMIKFLSRYDTELESLFLWCNEIFEKCITDTVENNSFNFDTSKMIIAKGTN